MMALLAVVFMAKAQDEEDNSLKISGSVDTYYRYDFSGENNSYTSFVSDQNSISIGMVNLIMEQSVGKASFVGDLSFGPRGQAQSILNADGQYDEDYNSFHIQNLYVSYAFTEVFSLTAGFMGTFVGYEVISPAANFNYSTSYLFSYGPFQNAGIKANFAFTDRVGLMVGLFNDWNVYTDFNGVSDFGAQLYLNPVDGWDVYLNFITGEPSGTEFDITTGFQISDGFYLGLNAADYTAPDDAGGFTGVALYPQVSLSESFGLGLRGEYFMFKDVEEDGFTIEGEDIFALTLSGNIKAGPLTVIPELRLDTASEDVFFDSDMMDTNSATKFIIAAVYSF